MATPTEAGQFAESVSAASEQDLLRNFLNRVAIDGSHDFNALHYLQSIATNSAILGIYPQRTAVAHHNDADRHLFIHCYPNMYLVIFDILLSINAATNISFVDAAGNYLLSTMYAPNNGQGYSFNSIRGKPLAPDKSLYIESSNAVAYSCDISYALVEFNSHLE